MNDVAKGSQDPSRQLVPLGEALPALRDPYGRTGWYVGNYDEQQSGLNLLEYLRLLNKHKWLMLSIVVAFAVLGAIRSFMQIPLYTSTVRIQIERESRVV